MDDLTHIAEAFNGPSFFSDSFPKQKHCSPKHLYAVSLVSIKLFLYIYIAYIHVSILRAKNISFMTTLGCKY